MPSKVSVVIPALNEAESIGSVVRSMPWGAIAECIVVDNGSTDATAEVAACRGCESGEFAAWIWCGMCGGREGRSGYEQCVGVSRW